MFKKALICLCLAGMMVLTACGGGQTPEPPPTLPSSEVPIEPDEITEASPEENGETAQPALEGEHQPIRTPEDYIAANENADIIIGENGSFYAEATRVPWIAQQLDLTDATSIATVGRSGVTEGFQAWDATVLPEGTEIMRHNQEAGVLIVEKDGERIPYLSYVG